MRGNFIVFFAVRRARANDTSGGEGLVEHLKELGDLNSGMASSVIQVYYSALVQNFFTPSAAIRLQALKVSNPHRRRSF